MEVKVIVFKGELIWYFVFFSFIIVFDRKIDVFDGVYFF